MRGQYQSIYLLKKMSKPKEIIIDGVKYVAESKTNKAEKLYS